MKVNPVETFYVPALQVLTCVFICIHTLLIRHHDCNVHSSLLALLFKLLFLFVFIISALVLSFVLNL